MWIVSGTELKIGEKYTKDINLRLFNEFNCCQFPVFLIGHYYL